MELIQLRSFVLAAQLRNLSQVAAHMYISQSSISKYIASLESELGLPLFNRVARGLEPTQFGLSFLPHAQAVLSAESAAQDFVMAQQRGGATLNLCLIDDLRDGSNIGFFRAYANTLSEFSRRHPDVRVNCNFHPYFEVLSLMHSAKADAAIIPVCDQFFDDGQNDVIRQYALLHSEHYLTVNRTLSACQAPGELGRALREIYFIPDQVNRDILSGLLRLLGSSARCIACAVPTELYLRVAAGGPHAAAIIPDHMAPTVCDMGVSFLSMNDLGLGSALYFVSERKNTSPYLQPFSELMKTHLEQEVRQRLPCRIVPYCFSELAPPNERKKTHPGA